MGISVQNVSKSIGSPPTRILFDINLEIQNGDFVALTGRSGSGKSTLLYLLSSLDSASEGKITIEGLPIGEKETEALFRFRNANMGFVFQFHYLLAELSSLENVLFPARKFGTQESVHPFAQSLLERFGLKEKMHRLPRELSGGEQQRVAIARALVMQPKYLFADEPTGSLDSVNGATVMNIIQETNSVAGTTVVLVTHDSDFAATAKRQIHLKDGRIVQSEKSGP